MRAKSFVLFLIFFVGCCTNVKVTKMYELYFDKETYDMFNAGVNAYQTQQFQKSDSILTLVINKSKDKFSASMPVEFNPYFYRASNNIELNKYQEALDDLKKVVSDTTTNTDILVVKTEAFKMLKQYDSAIIICNKLLTLKIDSSIVLSQRGICYYQKKELEKACADFTLCKKLSSKDYSFLNKFMKDCQ
ncbi:MAG: hypothetical protein C0459_02835 [Chitinophaga sp.]|jgi:tetratricopeptide (TPR) repeat protein|nr:hypothetical protein [Chitinophaga sp.]